jgi:hypothetical protein
MVLIPPTSSGLSISSSRLRDYTFFTDRDSDGDFHNALVAASLSVERHDDYFDPWKLVDDQEWIGLCASRGWIGVTSDRRIRRNPLAQRLIISTSARLLINIGRATHAERGANFVASLDLILAFMDATPKPWIAKVYLRRGGVKPWFTGVSVPWPIRGKS